MRRCPVVPVDCITASACTDAVTVPEALLSLSPSAMTTEYRVLARALALALQPCMADSEAIQELRDLAGGDPTLLTGAWMDAMEHSFRLPCEPIIRAEHLLLEAATLEAQRTAEGPRVSVDGGEHSVLPDAC